MTKARYHQEFREPKELTVLKTHADGTIDIGPEGGAAVVTQCRVTTQPTPGSATLVVDEPKKETPKEDKTKKETSASKK